MTLPSPGGQWGGRCCPLFAHYPEPEKVEATAAESAAAPLRLDPRKVVDASLQRFDQSTVAAECFAPRSDAEECFAPQSETEECVVPRPDAEECQIPDFEHDSS